MSEQNTKLQIAPPEKMDIESLFQWVKTMAQLSSEKCQEAEKFYATMKAYHDDIAELMTEMTRFHKKGKLTEEEQEEAAATMEAVQEIMESLVSLSEGVMESKEASDLDAMAAEIAEEDKGAAFKEMQSDAQIFIKKYRELKARLGLETQEEVAKLTGIDRRYISVIEQGKHRPQFKTIKKIADAFGVPVSELM